MAPGFRSLCACSFLSTKRRVQQRTDARMAEERVEVLARDAAHLLPRGVFCMTAQWEDLVAAFHTPPTSQLLPPARCFLSSSGSRCL